MNPLRVQENMIVVHLQITVFTVIRLEELYKHLTHLKE